jgi:hypothetical protein
MAGAKAAQVAVKLVRCDNPGAANAQQRLHEFHAGHWAAHHGLWGRAGFVHQQDQRAMLFLQIARALANADI